MQKLRNIKWLLVLMALSILAIAAFQVYWLRKAYEREDRTLDMRTNILFRETVRNLQANKLKLDRMDTIKTTSLVIHEKKGSEIKLRTPDPKMAGMIDAMMQKIGDTGKNKVYLRTQTLDSFRLFSQSRGGHGRDRLIQYLFDVDSLQDSLKIKELCLAYDKMMEPENINIPLSISR